MCIAQGVTISNDGATIMKLLEIIHPAAKTLVDISLSQDAEVMLQHAKLQHCRHFAAMAACWYQAQVEHDSSLVVSCLTSPPNLHAQHVSCRMLA